MVLRKCFISRGGESVPVPLSNMLARREGRGAQLVERIPFVGVKRVRRRGRVRLVAEMLVRPQPQAGFVAEARLEVIPARLRDFAERGGGRAFEDAQARLARAVVLR